VRIAAALLAAGASLGAHAGILTAPAADLEVSLITYGPGVIYWERFGHDAIRIRDRVSGDSQDFNYGVFDFADSAFLLNFARGRMRYMIEADPSASNEKDFTDEGRSVLEQRLAFSPAQAAQLRKFLIWNLRPENVTYAYDYLTSNCSTRIRDALNGALGGVLRPQLSARPAPQTYRQEIDRLMRPQPGLMLPMDLGLGPSTDRPLNEWQESFLPMVLAQQLRSVRIDDGHGGTQPLVVSERELSPNRLPAPKDTPPDLELPLGLAGLALAVIMLGARRRYRLLSAGLATAYVGLSGFFGLVLLALWTLTTHFAAWGNQNLLVFNPVAFLMLGAAWRTRKGVMAQGWVRTLCAAQAAVALLASAAHLVPGLHLQNPAWLLFATPMWIAVALGLCAP